jgi:ribosomal protein S18 acetylase RimI-like enzyme
MLRLAPLGEHMPKIRTIFNRIFDPSENPYFDAFVDCGASVVGLDRRGDVQAFMLIQEYASVQDSTKVEGSSTLVLDGTHEIAYLGILPRYQRKGYGERFIRMAQSRFTSLRLIVAVDNLGAIALYTRMGFVKQGEAYMWTSKIGKPGCQCI